MFMNRLSIKGGYGEHGRSCFLLPLNPLCAPQNGSLPVQHLKGAPQAQEERYYMLDCGIMDTDPDPYPQVDPDLLARTEYLFLSHCHKDHSGAFEEFVRRGFRGWLVTTQPTLDFSGIQWEKTIILENPKGDGTDEKHLDGGLSFSYGMTGHCAGSVWFHFHDPFGSVLYTGDYQRDALAYRTDPIEGRTADLAIMDCAHVKEMGDADSLRGKMTRTVGRWVKDGRKVLMPLPKYGRGLEVICMLRKSLPHARIAADRNMINLILKTLAYPQWLKPEALREIPAFLEEKPEQRLCSGSYHILLLGDTHLENPESRPLACGLSDQGAAVLLTGRVKKGCLTERLLAEGKAVTMAYPHHQSRGDFLKMAGQNDFRIMLPFHNPEKEIFWGRPESQLK